jgi:N-acetylneuraminate synthase/N,N'-diacetyllegionaminate synthase
MIKPIDISGRSIGPGAPCFIAAEIGINHNGDIQLAHNMIDVAADAGADAVKFQNYRTEDFLSGRELTYTYISQGHEVTESQWDMFKRCELGAEALAKLRRHCECRNLAFFSTPTSEAGIEQLVRLGAHLLKNGSDYLVHLPLIRKMAQSGLPTVLSTGMATVEEIEDAVQAFRNAGGRDLILLHCTSSYPTPRVDVNLRRIPELQKRFGCPVGLSDHTDGTTAAIGSVALGACMIEKHFTTDKSLPGPDQHFSVAPQEFRALVRAVRELQEQMGTAEIRPTPSEEKGRREFRLSCVAARNLPAGHTLEGVDIAFRRPGDGLPPKQADRLVGCQLVLPVCAGDQLTLEKVRRERNGE